MAVWALFIDDILVGFELPKGLDLPFAWISLIFMCLFAIEQAVRMYLDPHYRYGFFSMLDAFGTVSMYTSIMPIFVHCQIGSTAVAGAGALGLSRLGRIMRLLRVIRVVKVIQACCKRRDGEAQKETTSAVGTRLNELIIMEVIIMTLILMFIYPQLSFSEVDKSRDVVFEQLIGAQSTLAQQLVSYEVTGEYLSEDFARLLHVKINSTRVMADFQYVQGAPDLEQYPSCFMASDLNPDNGCPSNISSLRCSALEKYTGESGADGDSNIAIWDNSKLMIQEALQQITVTCFLIGLLFAMFTFLSNDVTSLVVRPIESMVDIVKKLAENPTLQLEGQTKSKYETEAVRVALAKIVGLMQLGFGGAGHEIISANLASTDGADLDLMLKGKKRDCAYGYCDIRQFTDTVECLQDQVMLFTNSVGEIIHQACHDNKGEPNKNIGDAFLIIWRPKSIEISEHTKVVDGALTAFRRCVREVASSQTLQLVTNVEAIHKKFGRDKYRTKIGFGLHFGWSVEGPVGTPTKIDCSYLSPEVKVSDRLEAATKIYSSNILMSGQFYDLLSEHLKVGIRLIDHITLNNRPFRVYADDRSNLWLKMHPKFIEIYGAEAAYEQFSKMFHEGIDAFIKGDWPTAQQRLDGAAEMCPHDTPTKLLLKEMKKRSSDPTVPTAPADWKGYHDSDV
uniref:Guanylate cyclase domain-containing protein n=1 Tax=Haptolina ericina TaxID=156174 RepID=A0A7S3F5E5_9EUKA